VLKVLCHELKNYSVMPSIHLQTGTYARKGYCTGYVEVRPSQYCTALGFNPPLSGVATNVSLRFLHVLAWIGSGLVRALEISHSFRECLDEFFLGMAGFQLQLHDSDFTSFFMSRLSVNCDQFRSILLHWHNSQ